jgi:hypothetical protein
MTANRTYTGIGSRETPPDVLATIHAYAGSLARLGWILRSGGAEGADTAFEQGARAVGGECEIFLPWEGFDGHYSQYCSPPKDAYLLAQYVHPRWDALTEAAMKLHARNAQQIMGVALDAPTNFVLCWTPGGKTQGGTATGIKLAQAYGIPVFNMAVPGWDSKLRDRFS